MSRPLLSDKQQFWFQQEEIKECCELIRNISNSCYITGNKSHKRKYEVEKEENFEMLSRLSGVTDAFFSTVNSADNDMCSDHSADNDIYSAWSVSSSPESVVKNRMIEKQEFHMPSLKSLSMDIF